MQTYLEAARNIQRESIRAIIYCRVSTDRQEDDGQSLDYQEEQGRRYCEQQGYQVIAVFREVQSGYAHYSYRQKLAQARQMIRDGQADVIITWDLRRFSRNFVHSALLFEEIEQAGGRIESVSERIDNSLTGKLIRSILSWCAESERQKNIEYANRHWQARLAAGLPMGASAPYGWRWENDTHTSYVINREEAAVRLSIFRMFVDEDMTIRAIKKKLEADGIPAPRGTGGWSPTTIYRFLKDEKNVGILTIAGWKRQLRETGKYTAVPVPERAKQIPGGIPRIVDDATFAHAQVKLKQNRVEKSRRLSEEEKEDFLLRAGYIFCASCGRRMTAKHSREEGYVYKIYACQYKDRGCSHASRIAAPAADAYVWEQCCKLFERGARLKQMLEQLIDEEISNVKPGQIEKDIAALQEKMAAAYKERSTRTPGSYFYDLITADLKNMDQQLQQMEAERRASAPIETRANYYKQRVLALIGFLSECQGRYHEATYQQKRDAMEILGVRALVAPAEKVGRSTYNTPDTRITVEFAPRFSLIATEVLTMPRRLVHLDKPLFVFRFDRTGALSITSNLAGEALHILTCQIA